MWLQNRTDWRLNEVSINVVSLFSGGGGLDLGFTADDYKIVSNSKQGRNLIVGNAVPPMLAGVIAHELKKFIEEDYVMQNTAYG